eukprot:6214600-Pleurochrysis_carterae.AAC.2
MVASASTGLSFEAYAPFAIATLPSFSFTIRWHCPCPCLLFPLLGWGPLLLPRCLGRSAAKPASAPSFLLLAPADL